VAVLTLMPAVAVPADDESDLEMSTRPTVSPSSSLVLLHLPDATQRNMQKNINTAKAINVNSCG